MSLRRPFALSPATPATQSSPRPHTFPSSLLHPRLRTFRISEQVSLPFESLFYIVFADLSSLLRSLNSLPPNTTTWTLKLARRPRRSHDRARIDKTYPRVHPCTLGRYSLHSLRVNSRNRVLAKQARTPRAMNIEGTWVHRRA